MSLPGGRRLEYERVADELRKMIVHGELRPGDRLPAESELTTRMRVSRGTLREALRVLSSQKLLVSARGVGGGTFVAEPSPDDVVAYLQTSLTLLSRSRLSVSQLLEVRSLMEVPAAGLAARHRTEDDLDRLAATIVVVSNRDAEDPSRYSANRGFHLLMLQASGNPLLDIVARPVFEVLRDRFLRDRAEPAFWERVAAEHTEILEHIRAGRPAAASRAMRSHLGNLRETYTRIDVTQLGNSASPAADPDVTDDAGTPFA
ncbi:FadR/GntR family transcriptional regulator [Jatrophihabitans endophyticus]|uniref:FadR/GntR family transcriptional regulator n=1 Tax=Jatrophihabitans endophyticus TaxID=1206085 RepID=UPI0019E1A40D|nr:FadR/GntR family transcriptional regulator [Jatrophihabitans endophyticus]MBE7189198.1 FadR family transcriptional regulator [Jatrophihabitans endophyticus]